jgi:hypothetical protein
MFIDDERNPAFLERFGFTRVEYVDMIVVRSSGAAIRYMVEHGVPEFISFDHDLGGKDTSQVVVKWMIEALLDKKIELPYNFDFFVHSQNPIGAKWIFDTVTGMTDEFLIAG